MLGRGVNFGGALDSDGGRGAGWLEERHFDVIRDAGFDTVRLPVKLVGAHEPDPRPTPSTAHGPSWWTGRSGVRCAAT